jgi:hypothetical protein
MPKITVTAELQNVTPDPKVPLQYQWKVTLSFNGQGCANATQRIIKHDDITQMTTTNKFPIPFTQVRGGSLTISVTVAVAGNTLTASTKDLLVTGTNPSVGALALVAQPNQSFRKLIRVESGLKQFVSDTCPLWSGDGYGGVGLCQLTSPAPTDDQVWSWKENVKGGWALYKQKEASAKAYPKSVRDGADFKALVKTFNEKRQAKLKSAAAGTPDAGTAAAGKADAGTAVPVKDLDIELPDYTDDQLERDTVRGFNGYAGMHEYRVKVDKDGVLVVTEDPGGTKGKAEWEQVTKDERIKFYDQNNVAKNKRGDPNYVEDVEAKPTF